MYRPLPSDPGLRALLSLALATGGCTSSNKPAPEPPTKTVQASETQSQTETQVEEQPATAKGADCERWQVGEALSPSESTDGWVMVMMGSDARFGEIAPSIQSSFGEPCGSASRPEACRASLTEPFDQALRVEGFQVGSRRWQLIATNDDELHRISSVDSLKAFLGPIDSAGDAKMLTWALGYTPVCPSPIPRADGFEVHSRQTVSDCPITTEEVTLTISTDGSHTSEVTSRDVSGACVGRLPPCLEPEKECPPDLPAWLAQAAWLEGQAVLAFEHLARELSHHGAPPRLIEACLAARADEVRHAAVLSDLARSEGVDPEPVREEHTAIRSLAEIAIDNAFEGLVRETWGATVGLFQAHHASHVGLRTAMEQIAPDEVRHAELSRAIHAWILPKLTRQERNLVEQARLAGWAAVRRGLHDQPPCRGQLGLPEPGIAARMVQVIESPPVRA